MWLQWYERLQVNKLKFRVHTQRLHVRWQPKSLDIESSVGERCYILVEYFLDMIRFYIL